MASSNNLNNSSNNIILINFSIDIINKNNNNLNSINSKRLLHPVNVIIENGTLFGILGGSGSGKVRNKV